MVHLDRFIPNLLELVRSEEHYEGCPEDDSCVCEHIQALTQELTLIKRAFTMLAMYEATSWGSDGRAPDLDECCKRKVNP